jgi:nitrate reductase beta subunit
VFLDPRDPAVIAEAERAGIPRDWIDAAQRSPVYALINDYKVALPLHPEYRTMPIVWYIPPLSPVVDVVRDTGHDAEDTGNLFAAIEALRIPVDSREGTGVPGTWAQSMTAPPVMLTSVAVIVVAQSEARNVATLATSS